MLKLTRCELQVLATYIETGRVKAVAETLNKSISTVRKQKKLATIKLGAKNSVDLVRSAIQKGLVKV